MLLEYFCNLNHEEFHPYSDCVTESLDEVTVISKKPTISRKADRLVFNVENTIAAQGTTWDILKRTPGVVVKQGELSVRNKNATVYLNGRKVELSFEEIQSLLESIGGNVIKSLEVITITRNLWDISKTLFWDKSLF